MTPGKSTTASFATKTMQPKVFKPMMSEINKTQRKKTSFIKIGADLYSYKSQFGSAKFLAIIENRFDRI